MDKNINCFVSNWAVVDKFYFLKCFPTFFFFKYLFIFRERGREREREGEKHQCVVAYHAPSMGTWPATQACAPTGK